MTVKMIERARNLIREHGWTVQGVSDHGCQCCADEGRAPRQTGKDPYLYTIGLTEAGLPELLLTLPGRNSQEWMNTGTQILNRIAHHSLHSEPKIGQTVATGRGRLAATLTEPVPFHRDEIWPGLTFELYGRYRVRFVQVVPNW